MLDIVILSCYWKIDQISIHEEVIMTMFEKKTYPSDLTTKQCNLFQSILHSIEPKKAGAPLKWQLEKIINAIMYVIKGSRDTLPASRGSPRK